MNIGIGGWLLLLVVGVVFFYVLRDEALSRRDRQRKSLDELFGILNESACSFEQLRRVLDSAQKISWSAIHRSGEERLDFYRAAIGHLREHLEKTKSELMAAWYRTPPEALMNEVSCNKYLEEIRVLNERATWLMRQHVLSAKEAEISVTKILRRPPQSSP